MTRPSKRHNCRWLSRTIDFPTCYKNVLILALLYCPCPFAYPHLRCLFKFLLILFFVLLLCLFNSFHVLVFNSEHCFEMVLFFLDNHYKIFQRLGISSFRVYVHRIGILLFLISLISKLRCPFSLFLIFSIVERNQCRRSRTYFLLVIVPEFCSGAFN